MLLVNLFGAPCSGKSTSAAGAFSLLKQSGINAEYVPENAKWFTYEGRQKTLAFQAYVHGKQLRDIERLVGHVDVAITDSPTLLSCIYGRTQRYPESFFQFVVDQFKSMGGLNILLNRVKPYQAAGRNQTEAESDRIAWEIMVLLDLHGIPFVRIDGDEDAPSKIVELVKMSMKKESQFA